MVNEEGYYRKNLAIRTIHKWRNAYFSKEKRISNVIEDDDIPIDPVVNMDQIPLSYISPGKCTFNPSGSKSVPIKGIDDKRQLKQRLVPWLLPWHIDVYQILNSLNIFCESLVEYS